MEDLLSKAKKGVRENTRFIDPGFFMFRGEVMLLFLYLSPLQTLLYLLVQEYQTVHADSVDTHSGHPSPSSSYRTSRPTKDTTVVFDSVDTTFGNLSSSSSRVNTSTQDTSSQTSCLDLPPLVLSPIPESRNELEAYLRWLCNTMDQIGRVRESAKLRLEELQEESKLQQEREVRRKLEAEVRRLQKEVAEYKWRDNVFGSMEQ